MLARKQNQNPAEQKSVSAKHQNICLPSDSTAKVLFCSLEAMIASEFILMRNQQCLKAKFLQLSINSFLYSFSYHVRDQACPTYCHFSFEQDVRELYRQVTQTTSLPVHLQDKTAF